MTVERRSEWTQVKHPYRHSSTSTRSHEPRTGIMHADPGHRRDRREGEGQAGHHHQVPLFFFFGIICFLGTDGRTDGRTDVRTDQLRTRARQLRFMYYMLSLSCAQRAAAGYRCHNSNVRCCAAAPHRTAPRRKPPHPPHPTPPHRTAPRRTKGP